MHVPHPPALFNWGINVSSASFSACRRESLPGDPRCSPGLTLNASWSLMGDPTPIEMGDEVNIGETVLAPASSNAGNHSELPTRKVRRSSELHRMLVQACATHLVIAERINHVVLLYLYTNIGHILSTMLVNGNAISRCQHLLRFLTAKHERPLPFDHQLNDDVVVRRNISAFRNQIAYLLAAISSK